ncbi:ubiquitin-like-specific protease 1D isoform X1 [Cannabis sativa]|uniref:ubiquitin-like-specific protease 1D isoform X1 n=1 Tax=Cannabis sativa TaxID=3483 RepID=UPI0029CAA8B6|nr:ubiquitin-like-specific protease 1D isoform X1 [Cannabis sativa]
MEDEVEAKKKKPLNLDWNELFSTKDDEPPPLVILKSETLTGAKAQRPSPEMSSDRRHEANEQLTDHELNERIRSTAINIKNGLASKLPDKGERLKNSLKALEDERERRKRKRVETIHLEESNELENPARSLSSSVAGESETFGGSEDFKKDSATSQEKTFASRFLQKMDGHTDSRTGNAFENEISLLGPCNSRRMRNNKAFSQKQEHNRSSTGVSPRNFYGNPSSEGGNIGLSNGNQTSRDSFVQSQDKGLKEKNDGFPVSNSYNTRTRRGQTIVLDEEEPQPQETMQEIEKLDESMREVKVYYPSRDDPECDVISYSDFDCLAPQCYLASTIMSFYMRYLQQHASPTNRAMHDCHFFNTFFYNKLKEAVSNKGNGKDFFTKLRRWWKGVNIFQKEYIFVPINEDLHWSLAIICNPDPKEESGPIVLHLDSLGLHSSKSVFQNIKRFLREEWQYLDQQATSSSDFPLPESIWRNLPNKITDKIITVPQQRNDYDCGLFVLFFMERFIEDAPERLKKKDLAMFGKKWFKPEEASGLREKIRKLLIEEFKKANANCTSESSQGSPPSVVLQEEFKNAKANCTSDSSQGSPPSVVLEE